MGDIGDYWREHRRYKENLGFRSQKRSTKTLLCECGKWFEGRFEHNQHARAKGKKGHQLKPQPEGIMTAKDIVHQLQDYYDGYITEGKAVQLIDQYAKSYALSVAREAAEELQESVFPNAGPEQGFYTKAISKAMLFQIEEKTKEEMK